MERVPAVEVVGLVKTYGSGVARVEAVRAVDLTVARGEFIAVMGPSGSGKSTLLHLLAGLAAPTSGTISIAGEPFSHQDDDALTVLRRRRIGFVFQAFQLIDVLSARENVALPLLLDGVADRDATARADELLDRVGLVERASHLPTELSGGEKQRVAIARALVHRPALLLADEPTGNLDSETGTQILQLMREVVDQGENSIVMVTHDAGAAALADRLIRIRDGQVIEQSGFDRATQLDSSEHE